MATLDHPLKTFDHVVVLMMENRSFDNVLGFLYDETPPKFNGAKGHSNPDKRDGQNVATSTSMSYHQPFPDPGEYIHQIFYQMYNDRNVDLNDTDCPPMTGFINDYYAVLNGLTELDEPFRWPGYPSIQCKAIMQSLEPSLIPALSALAEKFALFDNWFCALPSATWPNRAFWHADTSWGFANNPQPGLLSDENPWDLRSWLDRSTGPSLFSALDDKFKGQRDNWRIYADQPIPLTGMIHYGELKDKCGPDYFRHLEYDDGKHPNFFADCHSGSLPKYAFLEPRFLDFVDHGLWHNDMHPSEWLKSPRWALWGPTVPGSVRLGDQLILKVYNALRASCLRDKTLFMIVFDEHGGTYDHVPPKQTTPPCASRFLNGKTTEYGFNFRRLGPRVPMIMVSSHICAKTIVHDELNHASFLKTMQDRWCLAPIGPRQEAAKGFASVFNSSTPREWPELEVHYPEGTFDPDTDDLAEILADDRPLNALQGLICEGIHEIAARNGVRLGPGLQGRYTASGARDLLRRMNDHLGRGG